jgi:hypothetical protein
MSADGFVQSSAGVLACEFKQRLAAWGRDAALTRRRDAYATIDPLLRVK